MKNNYAYGSLESYLDFGTLAFPIRWDAIFGNARPLELEIGFGTGEYLVGIAAAAPQTNFIGFEQDTKRIIKTLRKIHEAQLTNVRVMSVDARAGVEELFGPDALQKIHCLFPCPWPKKRHAKNRLFSSDFLKLMNTRLINGGVLKVVTDHAPYVAWIKENIPGSGFSVEARVIPPTYRTKFEKKWQESGQAEFYELVFTKMSAVLVEEKERGIMQKYLIAKADPAQAVFENLVGRVCVEFKEPLFDAARGQGMVLAIVTEDKRTQYLWIMIEQTPKGWRVGAAQGLNILPTEGVRLALVKARDAYENSGHA
ncbi:MAG: tRNA (guanosine(46)-N7)-methyltransferase TrmB [Candidatus Omnitrophica bacterium]|nr:tRNA (guanosine(46)-N7)-methyltransferase TrmB [Candidatus Omnitrophota bacterium]